MTITKFKITGMHCASCKALIEEVCKDVSGVRSCTVDASAEIASVDHDDSLDPGAIIEEIKTLGDYTATII